MTPEGSGKSTLMRILAGLESPDEGEIWLEGLPIRLRSPKDAARHGTIDILQNWAAYAFAWNQIIVIS